MSTTILASAQMDGLATEILGHSLDVTEQMFAEAIEAAVLQSIATDPERVEAAARALSKHLDYPWEFMTSQGRDSMREAARATINAAAKEQP